VGVALQVRFLLLACISGSFSGFWVVKLVGVSPIFLMIFFFLRVLFLFLCWEGLWLG